MTGSSEEDSNKQPHVELPLVPNDNTLRNATLITLKGTAAMDIYGSRL